MEGVPLPGQLQKPFRRPAKNSLARQPPDRALNQRWILGHGADELLLRLPAGETEPGVRRVASPQQIAGRDLQKTQNLAEAHSP